MKVSQNQIYKIAEIALDNFKRQSPNLSWENQVGSITDSERRAIAYTEAVGHVLGLEVNVEFWKQVGKAAYVKNGEVR